MHETTARALYSRKPLRIQRIFWHKRTAAAEPGIAWMANIQFSDFTSAFQQESFNGVPRQIFGESAPHRRVKAIIRYESVHRTYFPCVDCAGHGHGHARLASAADGTKNRATKHQIEILQVAPRHVCVRCVYKLYALTWPKCMDEPVGWSWWCVCGRVFLSPLPHARFRFVFTCKTCKICFQNLSPSVVHAAAWPGMEWSDPKITRKKKKKNQTWCKRRNRATILPKQIFT